MKHGLNTDFFDANSICAIGAIRVKSLVAEQRGKLASYEVAGVGG
jgi:hypothetical protein